MTFNAIVGNPPYQIVQASEKSTTNSAFASAIYPLFIDIACKLRPNYVSMITPSRWMTRTGQGISDKWVDSMLGGNHFMVIHDYPNATDCFTGVEIKGGVNYFLYSDDYSGKCEHIMHRDGVTHSNTDYLDSLGVGIVIRDARAMDILKRVIAVEGNFYEKESFADIVSPQHFFDKDGLLTTSWRGYSLVRDASHTIKYYLNKTLEKSGVAWIKKTDIPKNQNVIPLHKIYIPKVGGSGSDPIVLGRPFYGEPGSVCSQTYLVIGYDPSKHHFTKEECENIISYIQTRFFRYMVSIKKKTQDNPSSVFQFVPIQDWSKTWTDAELYKKYGFNRAEIDYIETMIKPMEGEALFAGDDLINPDFGNFSLFECGVKIGDMIVYTPTSMELTVVGDNEVEYGGEKYTLSQFTAKYLPRNKRSVSGVCQGPRYFSFNGVSLYKMKESFLGGQK